MPGGLGCTCRIGCQTHADDDPRVEAEVAREQGGRGGELLVVADGGDERVGVGILTRPLLLPVEVGEDRLEPRRRVPGPAAQELVRCAGLELGDPVRGAVGVGERVAEVAALAQAVDEFGETSSRARNALAFDPGGELRVVVGRDPGLRALLGREVLRGRESAGHDRVRVTVGETAAGTVSSPIAALSPVAATSIAEPLAAS